MPMNPEPIKRPGMDSTERLMKFFRAKGQANVVMRCVDCHELTRNSREQLQVLLVMMGLAPSSGQAAANLINDPKGYLLRLFPNGWIILPMAKLEKLGLADLEQLQVVVHDYKNIRLEKGEPHRVDTCEKCGGKGCKQCDEGKVITFLEVSEEEAALAMDPDAGKVL